MSYVYSLHAVTHEAKKSLHLHVGMTRDWGYCHHLTLTLTSHHSSHNSHETTPLDLIG